jgi:ATP-dependent helicase HrpB
VIFDEFHERSIHADLGLALTLHSRTLVRDDLRVLVMSATLDGEPVATLLGGAPVLTSPGRVYPVETRYRPRREGSRLEAEVAGAVRQALADESGDVLVFLPGAGEIRRTAGLLQGSLSADGDPAARQPVGRGAGPGDPAQPARTPQGGSRHFDRRDQPDHRGGPGRDRCRLVESLPLLPADRHGSAGHGPRIPSLG